MRARDQVSAGFSAAKVRAPMARPCDLCKGRRVIVLDGDRITRCPRCSHLDDPPAGAAMPGIAPVDAVARAA